jgi:uncharacterized membrane protein YphA (DoxX/SURF4 family)
MTHRAEPPEISGSELAAGIGVMFAAVMMIVNGIFQIFQGLAAVMTDEFFVTIPNYVVTVDVTTWGWIHLVLGVLIVIGGFYLFSGSRAAAVFALVLAIISTIGNFAFIPYYPVWALLLIAVDVYIMWAIARSGVLERDTI